LDHLDDDPMNEKVTYKLAKYKSTFKKTELKLKFLCSGLGNLANLKLNILKTSLCVCLSLLKTPVCSCVASKLSIQTFFYYLNSCGITCSIYIVVSQKDIYFLYFFLIIISYFKNKLPDNK
jgi:hypothetical protein